MKSFDGFLKGVNLGGWISQFDKYDTKHFDTFIGKQDIKEIAALGFDHVRIPVDYNVLEDEEGNILESGFAYLENCRAWCEKYGLHMLIDLHECYGYSFEPLNEVVLAEVKDAWNDIVTRYIQMIRSISPKAYIIVGGVCYNNVLSVPLLDVPIDDRIVYNFHCYEPLIFTHQGAYWVETMDKDFRIGYPKTLDLWMTALPV